jgi:hypothetical protein
MPSNPSYLKKISPTTFMNMRQAVSLGDIMSHPDGGGPKVIEESVPTLLVNGEEIYFGEISSGLGKGYADVTCVCEIERPTPRERVVTELIE